MRWFAPSKPPSPHFSWAEVIGKSGYGRVPLGMTYIGRGRFVMTPRINARRHTANLEQLRRRVNLERGLHGLGSTSLSVISWARSYEHNKAVGGASNSQHLYFLATDIALGEILRMCPWTGGRQTFDQLLDVVFERGGVGLYVPGNRHCDSRGTRARWTHQ